MSLTLLLDLDDTLLDSNMQVFIPAYFKALSGALNVLVEPEVMLQALMVGTRRMMVNEDPALTLREVFDDHFFPKLGLDRSKLQPAIDSFYDEVFPTLRDLTRPRDEAVLFVEWAIAQGHRVVIATNPLFPLKAIQHRMRWAGLPPETYRFALVSSYETFHFTKASPAYYAEILGQLGCPAGAVVMIGDDYEMDIVSAQSAGLPVFWIKKPGDAVEGTAGIPQGTLNDVRSWLENSDLQSLEPAYNEASSLLYILRATPAALVTLTSGLSPQKWLCAPKEGEWCLTEIMCHLRDVDLDVNLTRLRKVLTEENPFITGEVTDRWVEERAYAKQDGRRALSQFVEARKDGLELLSNPNINWARPARHAIFGPTTLLELIKFIAEHDQAHLRQTYETAL